MCDRNKAEDMCRFSFLLKSVLYPREGSIGVGVNKAGAIIVGLMAGFGQAGGICGKIPTIIFDEMS